MTLAETLGDRFAATLKEWLTPKEFEEKPRSRFVLTIGRETRT